MKLSASEKGFTAVFFVLVIVELFSSTIKALSGLHNIAKPLLVGSLILFFLLNGKHLSLKTRKFTMLALSLSLAGDILIMFDDVSINYFLAGLISFLLAHIMYIYVFLNKRNNKIKPIIFTSLLVLYAIGFIYILKDGLESMLIPVIIYMLAILVMAISASLRKNTVSNMSYILVLSGALLFMISDSFIAINKFYTEVSGEHLIIMSTYALAQYCIVMGVLQQDNRTK